MTDALDNLRRLAEALPGPYMRFEVRAGGVERFVAELARAGVRSVSFAEGEDVSITTGLSAYEGVRIVTCNALPLNMAALVDQDGKVVAMFDMGESV